MAADGFRVRLTRLFGGLAALCALPLAAQASPVVYDLSFSTSGQSIWGSGSSIMLNETKFFGAQWRDKRAGIDLIAGQEDTPVINPLRVAYDVAFGACRGLGFSSSVCINGQTAQAPVLGLGSRPSVRSCGFFNVGCEIARAGDLIRRAGYDIAFAGCRVAFSASVCRNGQPAKLPVIALGTAPPQFLEVDTRTGVALNGTSDGRVGLELGLAVDSGSVDATVSYEATLDLPDTTGLDKSVPINFNPNSQLAGVNTLNTSFSNVELSVDAVMQLSGSIRAEACLIPAGCAVGATPFNIDERAPILSFNEDGEGGILFLGQTPSDLGIPRADGFPVSLDVAGLATATLHLPQPSAAGGLDVGTQTLKAAGQDDLVDLLVDLDNVVATAAGLPGLFGAEFDVGPLGSVGYDIVNVEMGPTVDLRQEFELDPTLFVSLFFDQAVEIAGELVTTYTAAWDLLPDITFLSDVTTVTPTFFIQADLTNRTLLDTDLQFVIDLLQVFYDFGLLGAGSFGVGNILDQAIDLFQSPNLFSDIFNLGGFNLQLGDSFIVDFLSGSSGPGTSSARSAVNTIILQANPAVPEPETAILFLLGLCALSALRATARRGASLATAA